jgi:hypothetical protein
MPVPARIARQTNNFKNDFIAILLQWYFGPGIRASGVAHEFYDRACKLHNRKQINSFGSAETQYGRSYPGQRRIS